MNKTLHQKKNRPYAGESAEERVARRKQQFLDAGLDLFGTIGFRATTVRNLCKQAQLTDRYFYESFPHTEDLLIAVYQNCLTNMQNRILHSLAQAPLVTESQLPSVIHNILNEMFTIVEDPRIVRVCWLEILGVSPKVDETYNKGYRHFTLMVSKLWRDVYPHEIDDDEWNILVTALIGAVSQAALFWLISGYRVSRATMVSATSRIFIGNFTREAKPQT